MRSISCCERFRCERMVVFFDGNALIFQSVGLAAFICLPFNGAGLGSEARAWELFLCVPADRQ